MTIERSGVLVVDKPAGMTSHDVVARVRRRLATKRVGHAGTLDPMATGVLVVLVGEGTKLGQFLTAHDKSYRARVALGDSTDSLDADGAIVARAPISDVVRGELASLGTGAELAADGAIAAAIAAEIARTEQVPPAHSAIHVDGKRSYDLARAGEAVELAPRSVLVRAIRVVGASAEADAPHLDLEVDVSKGYYVRSLARDLGERLGTLAHLAALRRLASGPYTLGRAVTLDAPSDEMLARLVPIAAAVLEAMPHGVLTADGVVRARQGKVLSAADFSVAPPVAPSTAWLDVEGRLVAIGTHAETGELTVQRGFVGG